MDGELKNRKNRTKLGETSKSSKTEEDTGALTLKKNDFANDSRHSDSGQAEQTNDDNQKKIGAHEKKSANGVTQTRPENEEIAENWIAMSHKLGFSFEIDLISTTLFIIALCTRFYKLAEPNNIVFDELYYGKYVSMYLKRTFFFDQHPPFGKQIIAAAAYLVGFNGNFNFSSIGAEYTENVPIFWLRFIPALCGSLLVPLVYHIMLQLKLSKWTAILGAVLIIFENALATQSQFILMEPMLLAFSLFGILLQLKFQEEYEKLTRTTQVAERASIIVLMLLYGLTSAISFTCAFCIKYVAFYSCLLGIFIGVSQIWKMLGNNSYSNLAIGIQVIFRGIIFIVVPVLVYVTIFRIHLGILNKAGPHDSVMTSAFQASLEGGLASITKGQPLKIAHGSQITLRHTHGRTCWLHSHTAVYPLRYPDKRGSSHQQQVTCYSFKDVNNWWIVKRPEKDDLVVENDETDEIRHGDVIQLIHGISSRGLCSHDVAAPMSPQSQEVACYIDYNISMPAQISWKVEILNRASEGDVWHAIKSQVRLVHTNTQGALRFSGRQLPDWGFNQHEVVCDRNLDHMDAVWNVEEHRYTKKADQKEREHELNNAQMIPTEATSLTFLEKFFELHRKMLWTSSSSDASTTHMYSSDPMDWPLMNKGIAYWIDKTSNAQIHLIGNIAIWYSGTLAIAVYFAMLVIYLMRRRRQCYDIAENTWLQFCKCGEILFVGYLLHFLPYFFVEHTLFLHNYLPALVFKIMLLCFVIEHLGQVLRQFFKSQQTSVVYTTTILFWLIIVLYVFQKFSLLTYGLLKIRDRPVAADDIIALRWKDTWDFIIHKELS